MLVAVDGVDVEYRFIVNRSIIHEYLEFIELDLL